MATSKGEEENKKLVHKLPQIFLSNKKITVLSDFNTKSLLKQSLKVVPYREDVIYESKEGDFLRSDENICLVNRFYLTSNSRRTLVRKVGRPNEVLKSSDDIVNLIGQENYDLIFSALCSVFSLELKVRGILALLTDRKFTENSAQTEEAYAKKYVDTQSQTDENCMHILARFKKRKRVKRSQLTAYVVKDEEPIVKPIKKVIIKPESFEEFSSKCDDKPVNKVIIKTESFEEFSSKCDNKPVKKVIITPESFEEFSCKCDDTETDRGSTLPILTLHDEDSNASTGNMSSLSINTLPHLLENPETLLNNIQKCTEPYTEKTTIIPHCPTTLTMLDGTRVTIPVKPEDDLHIATSDILNSLMPEQQAKLKILQAYFDWKYCLERDEDGNLPLHNAVNTGDMELLRRQCFVLKIRKESVDILAGNMTALQMSLFQKNAAATALLLQFGADPLRTDSENRTCVHLAAEESTDHLMTIINHCRCDPLSIIRENEELWKPEIETKSKEEQAAYLLDRISQLTDNSGYTPLMLASKLGIFENVKTLVEMAPKSVNLQMTSNGNTALYLAVSAACIDASNKGNLRKVGENYMKIVSKLVENGADPALENHAGHSVNILLTEFSIGDLSLLIANKMTAINCSKNGGHIENLNAKTFDNFILIKDKNGKIIKETKKEKPVILENIRVDAKIIDNSKLVVNKVDSAKTVKNEDNKYFMGTFRNFIRDGRESKTISQVDLTKPNSMIVIKDTKRMKRGKFIVDATPAKLMKIKDEKDGSVSGSSSKKD